MEKKNSIPDLFVMNIAIFICDSFEKCSYYFCTRRNIQQLIVLLFDFLGFPDLPS